MFLRTLAVAGLVAAAGPAAAQNAPAPEGASVHIISPEDGASASGPVTVLFGVRGMGIAPAGVAHEKTGHHHLLIDVSPDDIDYESAIPADAQHVHFGGGQTQTTIELAPGEHTLRLLMGDQNHVSFDPPILSEPVTLIVE